jgi:hypothetical protein
MSTVQIKAKRKKYPIDSYDSNDAQQALKASKGVLKQLLNQKEDVSKLKNLKHPLVKYINLKLIDCSLPH